MNKLGIKNLTVIVALSVLLITIVSIFGILTKLNNAKELNIAQEKYKSIELTESEKEAGKNGYVSSISILYDERKTGTAPFDDIEGNGNDTSEDDNIVRSYDQVSWTIDIAMALKSGQVSSLKGGVIHIIATLPENCKDNVVWDLDSMSWASETGNISEDGRTLTAYYRMDSNEVKIPGSQTVVLIANVLGARNGLNFAPTFTVYIEGNQENEAKSVTDNDPIVVSANANGKYNLAVIDENSSYSILVNQEEKIISKYSLGFMIVGDNESKGIKGIEKPKGPLTFNINYSLTRYNDSNNPNDTTDVSEYLNLYNYKYNDTYNYTLGNPENSLDKLPSTYRYSMSGNIPWDDSYRDDVSNLELNYVYQNGDITMIDNGNGTITVTISDFDSIPELFPTNTGYTRKEIPKNIGYISVGLFYMEMDINEETQKENSQMYYTIEIDEMNVKSVGETIQNKESTLEDNVITSTYIINEEGKFDKQIILYKYEGGYISSAWNTGDGVATREQIVLADSVIRNDTNNSVANWIYGLDILTKFDDKVFEPILLDGLYAYKAIGSYGDTDIEFQILYAAKSDGTGWISDEEMNKTTMEDLVYYSSIEELKENGSTCVAIMAESTSGVIKSGIGLDMLIPLKIKETAKIGYVGQVLNDVRVYTEGNAPDRTTQTHLKTNNKEDFPEITWAEENTIYIKTEYDENGGYVQGTHFNGVYAGDSCLVVGGTKSITITSTDKDNNPKTNFNIGENENEVRFILNPLVSVEENTTITDVTLRVESILPVGLTYIEDSSNLKDIDVKVNEDGTTTLTWYIYDYSSDYKIPTIYYNAYINPETTNGTQYNVSTIIVEEPDEKGNYKIGNSNNEYSSSITGIQITNLASHIIYKQTDTPVIEKNGTIKYTLVYRNASEYDVENLKVLDILPYNGDSRGTDFSGTYTLYNIKTIEGAENLTIYTTNDEKIRENGLVSDVDIINTYNFVQADNVIDITLSEKENNATAIFLTGAVKAGERVEIDIYLKTNGNESSDTYVNNATCQAIEETVIETTNIKVEVVSREISGKVWYDANENGLIDEGEGYAKGIELELKKADGSKAVDVEGKEVANVTTNNEGEYSFNNLPEGEYIVELIGDSYKLTKANVGNNIEINSKFEETEEGKKESYIISLSGIQGAEIIEEHVNAGILANVNIEVTKVWNHTNNIYGEPKEIQVQVKNGTEVVEEKVLNSSNKVGDDENTWTWTFEELPKYDVDGNEIDYTVEEVEVTEGDLDYYKTEIEYGETTEDDTKQVTIYNTYNGPVIEANKEMATEMGLSYVVEGEKITYTINVENRGEVGTEVLVKDSIPEGTMFVEGSIKVNGVTDAGKTAEDLAQGIEVYVPARESSEVAGEGRVSFEVIVEEETEENGTIRNTGSINKNPEEPESPDEPTNEVKVPALTYNKTAEIIRTTAEEITEGAVTAGDRIKYTITVRNNGDEAIEKVEITDEIPEGTTIYQINDNGEISLNGTNEIVWEVAEIGAGEEVEVSFEVAVNYDANENTIRNVGKVDGKETNEVETPYEVPDIGLESSIVKDGTERITDAEEKVSYTINYRAEVREFEGKGVLTIVDYLPYEIDEENSILNGGTYNQEDRTITWVEDIGNINTYIDAEGITTIDRTKTLTLSYNYPEVENLSGTIENRVEGTIRLIQEQEVEDPENPDGTVTEEVVVKEETKEDNHEVVVEIPAKVIVHHYIYDEAKGGETTEEVPAKDGGTVADEEIKGIVGERYETTPSDKINANYECVNTEPENFAGAMTKTDTEVTYYYRLKTAEIESEIEKTAEASNGNVLTDEDGVITYHITYRARIKECEGKATITIVDRLPYELATTADGRLVDEIDLDGGTYNAIDKTITWTEEVEVDTFTAGEMYDETFEKEIQIVYKDQNVVETLVNEVTGTVTIYYPESHSTTPGEERDTNTITDTAEVEQEYKVAKEVEKVWDDNNNAKGNRPASVTVQLTANGSTMYNGQELEKVVLSNNNNWSYTFTNLPKYDGFGNEITYSVIETETNEGDLEYYAPPVITTGELEAGEGEEPATTPNGKITVTNKYKLMNTNLQSSIEKTGTDKITSSKDEVTYNISYNATITDYIGEAVVRIIDTLPYKLATTENGSLVAGINLNGGTYDEATQTITWEQTIEHINTYTNGDYELEISKEITVVYGNLDASQRNMTNHVRGTIDLYETEQTNTVEDTHNTEIEIPGNVIVKYVDRETGEEITYTEQDGEETVEKTYGYKIEGLVGDPYTTELKEIQGYTYIENSGNTAGNIIEGTIEVTYYYERTTSGGVHVTYVDEDGNKIAEDENYTGKVGDKYTAEQKDIYGYEYVRVEGEPAGEMTEGTIEVVYVYKKLPAKVIVRYLEKDETPDDDSDNRVLYPEETIEGYVGDSYTTERKEIANYKPAEPEPENKTGKMEEEDIYVIYYYEKIPSGKVIAQYVDIDTMEEILYRDEETGEYKTYREESQGYVGDNYTTEEKEIPYYKLVEETIPANKEGKYVEEDIYVTYYYEKLEFNIGVDKNVVEILINGEEQKVLDGKLNKVEVVGSKINSTEIKITYSILVSNTGEIDGTARIEEDIPKNFELNSETGDEWKETEDGTLEAEVELKAGETKELKVVLNWIKGDYRFGDQKNTVKIVETSNPAGYKETTTEDNESSAEVVMGVKTGSEISEVATMIALIGITMIALLCIYIANKQKKDMIK